MSYDPCIDCGGMAWPDMKRCSTCEIASLRRDLDAARAEVERLKKVVVWQTKNADNCRADASRMGRLWEQAVKDWKAAEARLAEAAEAEVEDHKRSHALAFAAGQEARHALAASESRLAEALAALNRLAEEAERTREVVKDEGLPAGWKLPHLLNAIVHARAVLARG
jgi:tRNA G26 N,N-dimethylase Trm1